MPPTLAPVLSVAGGLGAALFFANPLFGMAGLALAGLLGRPGAAPSPVLAKLARPPPLGIGVLRI